MKPKPIPVEVSLKEWHADPAYLAALRALDEEFNRVAAELEGGSDKSKHR